MPSARIQHLDPSRRVARRGRHPGPLLVALLVLLVLLFLASALGAQTGAEGLVTFQFSFSNPGARSLGLGGAFVALADDATAAFANPAGLVQLLEPELSLEGRLWDYSTPFTRGGRIDGQPTGRGIDTSPGLRTAESSDTLAGLSFLSLVYPRGRWSFALYRHQLADFEFSSRTEALFRQSDPPFPPTSTTRPLDVAASTDLEIASWGASAGWRVSESLSLGLGVAYSDARLASQSQFFFLDSFDNFWIANRYLPESLVGTVSLSVDENDVGLNGGLLWRISDVWRIGGFFRQGPELRIRLENRAGPHPFLGRPEGTLLETLESDLDFPDVYGLGVAYRSTDGGLTVSFEWDRVEYSTILESLGAGAGSAKLDDADELRLGGEYVLSRTSPVLGVRLGAWLDPDHRVRQTGDDPLERALFRPGDDELHLAGGLGLAFRSLQVDLGVDISDVVDTASISAIYSF